MKLRIETTTKNGRVESKIEVDGVRMHPHEASRYVTGTTHEDRYGVFTCNIKSMPFQFRCHRGTEEGTIDFVFPPMPVYDVQELRERIETVRYEVQKNDGIVVLEFEV